MNIYLENEDDTVLEIKYRIAEKKKLPLDQIELLLAGRTLSDGESIHPLGKHPLRLLCSIKNIGKGGAFMSLGRYALDPRSDEDLSEIKDDGKRGKRAGMTYCPPFHYKKYALKRPCVDGRPFDESGTDKAKAYVAVSPNSIRDFIQHGTPPDEMLITGCCPFPLIASPDAKVAEQMAETFPFRGSAYKTLVEVQVSLEVINESKMGSHPSHRLWGFWSCEDIWPTAVWLKEVGSDVVTMPQLDHQSLELHYPVAQHVGLPRQDP